MGAYLTIFIDRLFAIIIIIHFAIIIFGNAF